MRRLLASMVVMGLASPAAAAAPAPSGDVKVLRVIARLDLGVTAGYGAIATDGSTAIISTGPCADGGSVKVVSLADPRRPQVVADIAERGRAVAMTGGGVAAVARDACEGTGVAVYDLADPAQPAAAAQLAAAAGTIDLVTRSEGRTIAVLGGATVRFVDLSDPAAPSDLATWAPPDRARCRAAHAFDQGRRALALCADRMHHLDLEDPSAPVLIGTAPPADGAVLPDRAAAAVLADRTLALLSQENGLRVLDIDRVPRQLAVLRSPGSQAPAGAVTSGDLAFVAWRADGVQVVDLAADLMPAVARFVPFGPEPDVIAVALLPNHLVALDATSGLWVAERPPEGPRTSNEDDLKLFLALLGIAGLVGLLVVPAVVRALSAAGRAVSAAPSRRVA